MLEYTVIIPTKNRPVMLRRAVESVLSQTVKPREIIIIDDASDDPPPSFEGDGGTVIRVIRHSTSRGGAASRNSGLEVAATEVVAFLDDDDEWLPHKMEEQLKIFQENPSIRLVACGHYRVEGGRKYVESFTNEFVHQFYRYDNFIGSFSYIVVRGSSSEERTFLDPKLPALQDWDFAMNIVSKGEFFILEEPLLFYYAHDQPRITTSSNNRIRGLRRFYFTHRKSLSPDERRWHLARIIYERSRHLPFQHRIRKVVQSIIPGLNAKLPPAVKFRTLAKRGLSLVLDIKTLTNLRSAFIDQMQRHRKASQ